MTSLFYAAVVLSMTAIGVAIYAAISAQDGYQDAEGFHSVASRSDSTKENEKEENVPPFLAAR